MSDIFPLTTGDERDPREDQNEERRREEEIKGDVPPHHGNPGNALLVHQRKTEFAQIGAHTRCTRIGTLAFPRSRSNSW
jgi:hypothetical protein